jgi:hypothetical protein
MALVTVTDDNGTVQTIIGIDNSKEGEVWLPTADEVFDGAAIHFDRGLARQGLLLTVIEALEVVRGREG